MLIAARVFGIRLGRRPSLTRLYTLPQSLIDDPQRYRRVRLPKG
jgi:hypothetical protein